MQAASTRNELMARAQPEMVGVSEDYLGAHRHKLIWQQPFDGPLGSDGHEDRRLNGEMRRVQESGTRAARPIAGNDREAVALVWLGIL
jgi:hypothetical protein